MRKIVPLALLLTTQLACLSVQPSLRGLGEIRGVVEWEYRYEVSCHEPERDAREVASFQTDLLNRLGKDRWELVSVQARESTDPGENDCWIFTFKRRPTRG
ncbi:MAG TPA: hypothetical protein VM557_08705 [Thermoanaerobaculia bacterium]|nr:hypothetical protein [Thermoanaerobaculia bacterium]